MVARRGANPRHADFQSLLKNDNLLAETAPSKVTAGDALWAPVTEILGSESHFGRCTGGGRLDASTLLGKVPIRETAISDRGKHHETSAQLRDFSLWHSSGSRRARFRHDSGRPG